MRTWAKSAKVLFFCLCHTSVHPIAIHTRDMVGPTLERFDPQSPGFASDPYSCYASLRKTRDPVFYEGMGGCWLLAGFQEVDQAARDPRLVRSMESFLSDEQVARERKRLNWHEMPNHQRYVQSSLLETDGSEHKVLRLLLQKCLTQGFLEAQRTYIQSHVDNLLNDLLQQRELDFVSDFASHVPGQVIGRMIGVPDEDCARLRVWSENIVQFFDVNRRPQHKLLAEQTTTTFAKYLKALIARRKTEPKDDLISGLVGSVMRGEMSETQLISSCMLLLMAGHGSTIDVLGTGLLSLIRNPEQLVTLAEAPDAVSSAVEEMFRYESPLPFFHRYASARGYCRWAPLPHRH